MGRQDHGVEKRYIVMPDQHMEFVFKPAINCVLQAIDIVKPTGFINLGDVGEWRGASHWEWKKKKRPPLDYQLLDINDDIGKVAIGVDITDEMLDKRNVGEKYILEGNHDLWLDNLVEENQSLARTSHKHGTGYGFRDVLNWERRGYTYYEAGKLLKLGKLHYYHGHLLGGIDHCRNHLLKWGVNVLYADKHDVQQRSITHKDGEKSAWSIGCLKRMDHAANKFLRRQPTNWGHAFSIVDYWKGGYFSVQVVRIIGGRCSLWGELIDGHKGPWK